MSPEEGLSEIDIVMDLETMGLGKCMNVLGDSKAISQPMKTD